MGNGRGQLSLHGARPVESTVPWRDWGLLTDGGRNELLLESVQAAKTGPPRDLSEEAVAIGDWEGDRGAMEEARQILKEPVENQRRIEDGGGFRQGRVGAR